MSVVLADVMDRVPEPVPALTVDPPPTWATAEELTTDTAIAASVGFRDVPSSFVPTVVEDSTETSTSAPIVVLPPAPLTVTLDEPVTETVALGSSSAIAAANPNAAAVPVAENSWSRAPPRALGVLVGRRGAGFNVDVVRREVRPREVDRDRRRGLSQQSRWNRPRFSPRR